MAQNFVRSIQETTRLLFCYQNNYVTVNRLGIVSTFKQLTEIPCLHWRAEMFDNGNIAEKMDAISFSSDHGLSWWQGLYIYNKRQSHGSHTVAWSQPHTLTHTHTLLPLRLLLCSTIVLEIKADHWNRKDNSKRKKVPVMLNINKTQTQYKGLVVSA